MNNTAPIRLILILLFIAAFNITNANDFNGFISLENAKLSNTTVNGSAEFKNSQFQSLTINGTLNFNNLTVLESVKIHGTLNGKNIECKRLVVAGSVKGDNIRVTRDTIVDGSMHVHNSYFEEVTIKSKKINLNDTITKNIIIKPAKNNVKQQLILKGKTIVNGDIIFESELGEVLLDNTAKITGQIKGGKVIFIDNNK